MLDEYGIITRNAERRAAYGNRLSHGKARTSMALPPVVVELEKLPKPAPEHNVTKLPVVHRVISEETMQRAINLELLTVKLGVSLAETSSMLAELEGLLERARAERSVEVRHIVRVVSVLSGVSVQDLQSPRRARHIARPRQVVMYLAKVHLGMSLPQIGRSLGNRDHTTIMHGHRKIARLMKVDDELAEFVARCEVVLEKRGSQPEHSAAAA